MDRPHDWPDRPSLPAPPDPEPLPVDALPLALRAHVQSVAGATQTPADMGVVLSLAAVPAALRGRAEIHVDARGCREMAVIYTAVVLPPAARKSPVYAHMVAPLAAWERDALTETGPDHRSAVDRAEVARATMVHVRSLAARGKATRSAVEDARLALDTAEAAVPSQTSAERSGRSSRVGSFGVGLMASGGVSRRGTSQTT